MFEFERKNLGSLILKGRKNTDPNWIRYVRYKLIKTFCQPNLVKALLRLQIYFNNHYYIIFLSNVKIVSNHCTGTVEGT